MRAMQAMTITAGWAEGIDRAATSPHRRGMSQIPIGTLRPRGEVCPQFTGEVCPQPAPEAVPARSVGVLLPGPSALVTPRAQLVATAGRRVDAIGVGSAEQYRNEKFRNEKFRIEQFRTTTHRTGDRAWRPPV